MHVFLSTCQTFYFHQPRNASKETRKIPLQASTTSCIKGHGFSLTFSSIETNIIAISQIPIYTFLSFSKTFLICSSNVFHCKMPGGKNIIGVALDFSKNSKLALQWALDRLANTGDSVFIIHVMKPRILDESHTQLWSKTGSRTCIYDHDNIYMV